MLTDIRYKGFEPSEELQAEAEGVLDQIQKCVPYGTAVIASLEFDGTFYVCSIDAHLKRGSFFAQATSHEATEALQHAEEAILKKVFKTKETQFFTRSNQLTNEKIKPSEYVN